MPQATAVERTDWVVVPDTPADIEAVARQCRRMVTKRALLAAGVAVVPIPGIDWITDVGVLVKLIPDINRAFGLTPDQIERLAPDRKVVVYKAISAGGSMLVGRLVTRELILKVLKTGRRTADHAAGRQVRADRRPGGVGDADVLGAEVRLRAAHQAVHGRVAAARAAEAGEGRSDATELILPATP